MPKRFWILGILLVICCTAFMTWGARGPLHFVIPFRATKLAALGLVGMSISTSTVLFQAVSQNRILSPSIMGFDALYIMILTAAVYFLGGMTVANLSAHLSFAVSTGVMVIGALGLFSTLLRSSQNNLMRMILTGIVFGALFRSLTDFMQRLIDPNEFSVIQTGSYARFTQIETDLLFIAAALCAGALFLTWKMRFRLDVLALGRDVAMNLGLNVRRTELEALTLTALLVAVTTALVGPVAFLGLLVVSLARLVVPVERHAPLLICAGLIAMIVLIGGQLLFERVFQLTTPLAVIIDLVGGSIFLFLLLKGHRR